MNIFSPDCVADHALRGGFARRDAKAGAAFVRQFQSSVYTTARAHHDRTAQQIAASRASPSGRRKPGSAMGCAQSRGELTHYPETS